MAHRGLAAVAALIVWSAAAVAAPRPAADEGRDLEGLWSSASLTPLERPAGFAELVATEAEARAFEASHNGGPLGAADPVGQTDSEWWEMGGRLTRIDGRARSSVIVEPADGRLPYSDAGRAALARSRAAMSNYDGPEVRPATERCLTGVGGASVPPLLTAGYNNHVQIVQTPAHVAIVTEMNHDARIVPLDAAPRPQTTSSWTGNSAGRWEGGTLVVRTTGFHPALGWRSPSPLFLSPAAEVTERFTRVSPGEIRYAFTVTDPAVFTRPWRGETTLRRTKGPMYEFACHEGNYSLTGVLAGARQAEAAASHGDSAGRQPAPSRARPQSRSGAPSGK